MWCSRIIVQYCRKNNTAGDSSLVILVTTTTSAPPACVLVIFVLYKFIIRIVLIYSPYEDDFDAMWNRFVRTMVRTVSRCYYWYKYWTLY